MLDIVRLPKKAESSCVIKLRQGLNVRFTGIECEQDPRQVRGYLAADLHIWFPGGVLLFGGFAVCGAADTQVVVTDFGNGTWTTVYSVGGVVVPLNSTGPLFNKTCAAFPGNLQLIATNSQRLPATTYNGPEFQAYLTALGLGSLITAGKYAYHAYHGSCTCMRLYAP